MPRKRDKTTKLPAPHGLYARPPTPGQVIQVLILDQYKMTVEMLADRLGINRGELVRVIAGRSPVDAEIGLRLSILTGTSPNIWIDMQRDVDLYDMRKAAAKSLEKIEPFPSPLRLRKLVMPTADDIDSVRP